MVEVKEKKRFCATTLLIALCWLVYSCSYIGKLSYNANITQVEMAFGISHDTAGLVGTFFFFAYGIGQIVNGLFCRKYNLKYVIFGALVVSSVMNVGVAVTSNFSIIKFLWLINGGALSVLWPSLMRLLSETIHKKDLSKAILAMGTTVATGTFIVYGLSSLFAVFHAFRVVFWIAGILIPCIAIVWLLFAQKLVKACKDEYAQEETKEEQKAETVKEKSKLGSYLVVSLCALAFFAVVDNLVKDGLTTWVPSILKETYRLPDFMSILLTLALPLFAVFGATLAVNLRKKIPDFVALCATFFLGASGLMALVIGCMDMGAAIPLISFAFISCLTSGVNNVITSMTPLYMKDKINTGLLAGLLNGFCYLGSTLSSYGLGSVAHAWGWSAVFWLLFGLCAAATVIGFAIFFAETIKKKRGRKDGAGTR